MSCSPVLQKKVVYETLKPLAGKVDTLVLGCTHYPLLRPIIQNVMGPEVQLIDSGAECVRDISVLLNYFEINRSRQLEDCHHQFYTRPMQPVLQRLPRLGCIKLFMWSM